MTIILNNIGLSRGGKNLISHLNLKIYAGESLFLKGPNGSGKTTFLEFLAELYSLKTGTIQKTKLYKFFLITNNTPLESKMNVKEHICFWAKLLSQDNYIKKAIKYFALEKLEKKYINNLSLGQKRCLLLSTLILIPHNVWLLDEPFIGLDKNNRNKLIKLCQQHMKKGGIIIISHHGCLPFKASKTLCLPSIKKHTNLKLNNLESWYV